MGRERGNKGFGPLGGYFFNHGIDLARGSLAPAPAKTAAPCWVAVLGGVSPEIRRQARNHQDRLASGPPSEQGMCITGETEMPQLCCRDNTRFRASETDARPR